MPRKISYHLSREELDKILGDFAEDTLAGPLKTTNISYQYDSNGELEAVCIDLKTTVVPVPTNVEPSAPTVEFD